MPASPDHRGIPGALSPDQLAAANATARSRSTSKGGNMVKEPKDNVYGRFKLLQRTDGLFVVHDTEEWPPNGPVFHSEDEAREHAQAKSRTAVAAKR
jgi:hypothetical protein